MSLIISVAWRWITISIWIDDCTAVHHIYFCGGHFGVSCVPPSSCNKLFPKKHSTAVSKMRYCVQQKWNFPESSFHRINEVRPEQTRGHGELSTHISAKRLLDTIHLEVSGILLDKIHRCCWVYGCACCIAVTLLAEKTAILLISWSNLAAHFKRVISNHDVLYMSTRPDPER